MVTGPVVAPGLGETHDGALELADRRSGPRGGRLPAAPAATPLPEPLTRNSASSFLGRLSRLPDIPEEALRTIWASRPFNQNETVEVCYCVRVTASGIGGTFLEKLCYNPQDSQRQGLRLLPLGLALMYNTSMEANLATHHEVDETDTHWLRFVALRAIGAGEELTVDHSGPRRDSQVPVLDAAKAWVQTGLGFFPKDRWRGLLGLSAKMYSSSKAPLADLSFGHGLAGKAVRVAHSPINGVGVFAQQNFSAGEVVDICPVMPLLAKDGRQRLLDYAFEGLSDDVDLLPLGASMIYNHSDYYNLTWWLSWQSEFVIIWTAVRDIQAGDELFHDYGDEYWLKGQVPNEADKVAHHSIGVRILSRLGAI